METRILADFYGLSYIEITNLNGYDNQNFSVKSDKGKFILKTYKAKPELQELIEGENQTLLNLNRDNENIFPNPIPNLSSNFLNYENGIISRLLSFVDGEFLGNVEHTPDLFFSFGKFLAKMDNQLLNFRNSAIKARQSNWDLQHLELNKKYISCISRPEKRKLVSYYFQQFREQVQPELNDLRKSIIHADANEWNVLVKNGKVSGIIDFGDMAYSPLINEVSIAITYGMMGKKNPLEWASYIIQGYHKHLPLLSREIDLLYYLVATRLCISVCNSAFSRQENPENEYISISEKPAWDLLEKWIAINPTLAAESFRNALGFDSIIQQDYQKEKATRDEHLSKALSLSFPQPIKMTGSAFQYMFDAAGKTYLDAYNNIPHVGHCHPKVVEAGQKQMAKLNTNTRYIYDQLNDYTEKLLSKFLGNLNKVFFVNSGSAASDLAIRLATNFTGKNKLMAMEYGYHGNTRMGIEMSHYKYGGKGGKGQAANILKAPIPDTYKGQFRENNGSAGKGYAHLAIDLMKENDAEIAAFIAEPVVGCGGQVPLANGYLKEIYPAIRAQGGICISDEVQVGFGRLGEYFWGFEMQEVIPDMVVLGKPMGNGHPMGAVVTTDAIAEAFANGMEFFSSFGGNPVSCAIGKAVLEVMGEEGLQENARQTGDYLKNLLLNLKEKHPEIGDIRGSGLFFGVELIQNYNRNQPATALAKNIQNGLKDMGILIGIDGPDNNVLKIKPPMCFTRNNADQLVEGLISQLQAK